jgi:DNA repair protein RadD
MGTEHHNQTTPIFEFLQHLSESQLRLLLPNGVASLLYDLDPQLARPARLRELIATSTELPWTLTDPKIVAEVLLGLPKDFAKELMTEILTKPVEDPYLEIDNLKISPSSSHYAKLVNYLGVEPANRNTETKTANVTEIIPRYGLYPHQLSAIRDSRKILKETDRFLVHMPTGSGKTRTAIHFLCQLLSERERGTVVWIANSEELCEQAASEFETAWATLGNRPLQVGRFWGSHNSDSLDIDDGIIVTGVQKLHSQLNHDPHSLLRVSSRSIAVVFDEAHQVMAPTYQDIVEYILSYNDKLILIGLTATPGRTWNDLYEDQELSDFFTRSKVTISTGDHDNPIDYLVSEGYLARPQFDSLLYQSGWEITDRDLEKVEHLDVPTKILRQYGEDRQRNILIIQKLRELVTRHLKVILFAPSVASSRLIAAALTALNVRSVSIDGETPSHVRAGAIQQMRELDDEPFVLCNYGVATTGVDIPKASCALIARPTGSLVLYSQMVGRVIRGPKVGGNATAEIVTVVDTNLPGFENISTAFMNWEDVWND